MNILIKKLLHVINYDLKNMQVFFHYQNNNYNNSVYFTKALEKKVLISWT